MPIADPLPPFDRHSKCVKCGHEIAEPEPVPPKPEAPGTAAKPKPKTPAKASEEAAVPPPKTPMQLPVQAPPPTVAYCNGVECPWYENEVVEEHMHQFCDICGYEWLSKPLG